MRGRSKKINSERRRKMKERRKMRRSNKGGN